MFITMFLPGPSPGRFLPYGGITARMLPVIRRELRVDVQQHDDEVIVVIDLHSVEEGDVSLQILNQ